MPERPLLIFPRPEPVPKPRGYGGGKPPPRPTNQRGQAERIEEQFSTILSAFVSDTPGDVERVLVMETSSRIDGLRNAVTRIPGLEWLAEMDVDEIDLHDIYDEQTGTQIKGGRFYIIASNRQATDRLLGLWRQHKAGGTFVRGLGIFKKLFEYLLTLRRWDIRDRFRDTGILEVWSEEYEIKKNTNSYIDFEIELHYRVDRARSNQILQEVSQRIENARGQIKQTIRIDDIAFHALKATLPVDCIGQVITHNWDTPESSDNFPPVFNSESVRYFRPTGQHIDVDGELSDHALQRESAPIEDAGKPPVLALFDGAPMLRHVMLDGRIDLYDPDNYMDVYEPLQQKHGTAMASLMCHGDLGHPQTERMSLARRIYARPVMKPNQEGMEAIPSEIFQEDIIERAVKEMFEGDDPVASHVRVINLSLGNIDQVYLHEMSPWARLLDWLTFKYKVLFIVSAGNYTESIKKVHTDSSTVFDSRQQLLQEIDENQRNHRLFSPAESMNALTVGALQGDACGDLENLIRGSDPIEDMNLPAPYSRIGPGFRSAIKPDIFTKGGRLLYETEQTDASSISPVKNNDLPGIQAAYPGAIPEQLNRTAYQAGTSHAAAIVSHGAGHIFEMLEEILEGHRETLSSDFDAVLIKTLLVHGATQGENSRAYDHLKNATNSRTFKRYRARYLGYGVIDIQRVLECARSRATAIGCGSIRENERHRFVFPLPINSAIQNYLRLTVTLAWFSPINPQHIGLRRAKLFFEGNELKGTRGHERQEADWQQVRKGTVQHEIFELNKNVLPGNSLEIFVQCGADAGALDDEIPYGLAVTLEVAESEHIDLYQLVRENIELRVKPSGV